MCFPCLFARLCVLDYLTTYMDGKAFRREKKEEIADRKKWAGRPRKHLASPVYRPSVCGSSVVLAWLSSCLFSSRFLYLACGISLRCFEGRGGNLAPICRSRCSLLSMYVP